MLRPTTFVPTCSNVSLFTAMTKGSTFSDVKVGRLSVVAQEYESHPNMVGCLLVPERRRGLP